MFENGTIVADALRLHLIQRALVRATANLSPQPRDATYFQDAAALVREIGAPEGAQNLDPSERTTRTWAPHDSSAGVELGRRPKVTNANTFDTEKLAQTAEAMCQWLRIGQNRPSIDDLRLLRTFVGLKMEEITNRERSRMERQHRAEHQTEWAFFGPFA